MYAGESMESSLQIRSGAGILIRGIAGIIDLIYGFILGFVMFLPAHVVLVMLYGANILPSNWRENFQHPSGFMIITGSFIAVLGHIFYQIICQGFYGASLGKLMCRLQVVSEDGQHCSPRQAIIRSLWWHIDTVFFGLVGYTAMNETPLNQRYGDRRAKTIVVKRSQIALIWPFTRFIGVFLVASFFWAASGILAIVIRVF